MNRNQAKQLLSVIQAYVAGKTIQSRCVKGDTSLWYDDEDPTFNEDYEYRIKPKSEYRSFKDAEECWDEMQKHQPFGWVEDYDGSKFTIETVDSSDSVYISDEGTCSFNEAFEKFKFTDGQPFGTKVEE